ncbi:MAG TPA: copper amine oxidase N-terminal domain-containing protein [Caldisericia bacterium]|nr:copper amine oxidase N-terminal domain-containing protein [Caldisericia bacterium]HPP43565.1 copper amine oxidase N-terminal domain-containing protein [Caldisericia bacterium]
MKKIILVLTSVLLIIGSFSIVKGADELDLFIKDVTLSKEIIFENDTFSVEIEIGVKNLKQSNNPLNFLVSIFWDMSSKYTHIDSKIVEINNVDKVKVKFNLDLSKKSFINQNINLLGDKSLIIQIDSGHNINEYDEKNNIYEMKIHIFKLSSLVLKIWINNPIGYVNNKKIELETPPIIVNNRTMVPLRFIIENFGGDIYWNSTDSSIKIVFPEKEILMWVNNSTAYINGKKYILDSPPIIIGGRTLVPVRFVVEALGAYVFWNSTDSGVTIIYEK